MVTTSNLKGTAYVNAYLILKDKSGKVLLSLRQNTGYRDGEYGLVSGHLEPFESAIDGMIREAKEESGIIIDKNNLKCVHILHRKTNRYNIDLFFSCETWLNNIVNKEPEKCQELIFVDPENLPENTMEYVKEVLYKVKNEIFYSDEGFDE